MGMNSLRHNLRKRSLVQPFSHGTIHSPFRTQILLHRFRAIIHLQLFVDGVVVLLDRTFRDAQPIGNFLVEQALGKLFQD